jgi:thiol-disulfide isomerase/thioredoxin
LNTLKKKVLILPLILTATVIVLFVIEHQSSPRIAKVGALVPEIELTDSQEKKLKLSELKGTVVFVNFWASWCQPCIDEIPSIEVLYRYLSGNSNFKMITILYQDDENRASRYMKQQGYTFPVYRDLDGSAVKRFGITGVPETYIIDKKGILRDKVVGPLEWDTQPVIQSFLNLINE